MVFVSDHRVFPHTVFPCAVHGVILQRSSPVEIYPPRALIPPRLIPSTTFYASRHFPSTRQYRRLSRQSHAKGLDRADAVPHKGFEGTGSARGPWRLRKDKGAARHKVRDEDGKESSRGIWPVFCEFVLGRFDI